MSTLNAELAELGADAGMAVAAAHADRDGDWSENAEKLFRMYATMHPQGFMTEEVRVWSEKLGFEPPPDNRAWGFVARRLSRDGYIKAMGFRKQVSSNCHGSPKTLWRKA